MIKLFGSKEKIQPQPDPKKEKQKKIAREALELLLSKETELTGRTILEGIGWSKKEIDTLVASEEFKQRREEIKEFNDIEQGRYKEEWQNHILEMFRGLAKGEGKGKGNFPKKRAQEIFKMLEAEKEKE